MTRRKRKMRPKKRRYGGALARRRTRLIDKIAEGASMFLAGPSPSVLKLGAKLAGQSVKGIVDNVKHYKRRIKR